MTKKLLFSFVLIGFALVPGCSSGKQSLSGKVTFSDDGSPVPTGTVTFETSTFFAQGTINSDGTYVVGTDTLTDGIPKGTYNVVVQASDTVAVPRPDGTQEYRSKPLIDSKYTNASTSGLTFTADGKTKKFDFTVDRAK